MRGASPCIALIALVLLSAGCVDVVHGPEEEEALGGRGDAVDEAVSNSSEQQTPEPDRARESDAGRDAEDGDARRADGGDAEGEARDPAASDDERADVPDGSDVDEEERRDEQDEAASQEAERDELGSEDDGAEDEDDGEEDEQSQQEEEPEDATEDQGIIDVDAVNDTIDEGVADAPDPITGGSNGTSDPDGDEEEGSGSTDSDGGKTLEIMSALTMAAREG